MTFFQPKQNLNKNNWGFEEGLQVYNLQEKKWVKSAKNGKKRDFSPKSDFLFMKVGLLLILL